MMSPGMSALSALGARGAGPLQFGEAHDDPTRKLLDRYLTASGGDHNLAAKAAWNDREKKRARINRAGGQSLLQVENEERFGGGDPQMLQVATKLKNLAASGGKTQGTYGAMPERVDPRMTTQGRAELGRIGTERAQKHGGLIQQMMGAADTEARNLREQQRMQIEGDQWAADNRRKSQAMLALGTRGASAGL
jgi:hypothetical protein